MSGNINFNGWINDDGSENYKCRAWVNFDGTGTVAIRASGNVSSITDNGTGTYTVNFVTAMPDANYAVCAAADSGNIGGSFQTSSAQTTTSCRVISYFPSFYVDVAQYNVAIFR